jgi:hypothetical protein
VKATVDEGRLVERPCPDCGGIERRAFGEFVSPRGELASYAIGWTSGGEHDRNVGYMTIGLGAGNPGGGSFHCDVFEQDGEYALLAVDRPFEDVPQGGPDLTREEALAHECIDFVWWVADEVMAQDRRARWMRHWLLGTRSFATTPVVEGSRPVQHVVRSADGEWQLLCGTVEATSDTIAVHHLFHAVDRDPTLLDVLDLAPGERADRETARSRLLRSRSRWVRSPFDEEE